MSVVLKRFSNESVETVSVVYSASVTSLRTVSVCVKRFSNESEEQ